MAAPGSYKVCPSCRTQAALDAQFCSKCGHQYRTQFTQVIQPVGATPPLQAAPAPGLPQYVTPMGPRDAFEFNVAVSWRWVLVTVLANATYFAVRFGLFDDAVLDLPLAVLLFFLTLIVATSLRRCYVYSNPRRTGWWVSLIVALLALASSIFSWETSLVRARKLAADERAEELRREAAEDRMLPTDYGRGSTYVPRSTRTGIEPERRTGGGGVDNRPARLGGSEPRTETFEMSPGMNQGTREQPEPDAPGTTSDATEEPPGN